MPVCRCPSAPRLEVEPDSAVDELWIQVADGGRVVELGRVLEHTLERLHRGVRGHQVVVPRELLNQRYRTQRTFSVVVGSVAALSLLVGGIGIMNIMLASVRGAHPRDRHPAHGGRHPPGRDHSVPHREPADDAVAAASSGIVTGVAVSWGITAYAGWSTQRLARPRCCWPLLVSFAVGLSFGIYPARRAAALEPIDALRYE